jgi:hypothetical protein
MIRHRGERPRITSRAKFVSTSAAVAPALRLRHCSALRALHRRCQRAFLVGRAGNLECDRSSWRRDCEIYRRDGCPGKRIYLCILLRSLYPVGNWRHCSGPVQSSVLTRITLETVTATCSTMGRSPRLIFRALYLHLLEGVTPRATWQVNTSILQASHTLFS